MQVQIGRRIHQHLTRLYNICTGSCGKYDKAVKVLVFSIVSAALEGLTEEEGPEFQEFHKSLG